MLDQLIKGAGALIDAGVNWAWGEKQEDSQHKFAHNAIQWKVKDAQKAGVHPLYALGAPTMSYSPVSIGGASNFSEVGQDISRAIGAGTPKAGQLSAYEAEVQRLNLQGMGLDNEYKAAQLARLRNELLQKPALPSFNLPGDVPFQPGPQTPAQKWQDQYGDVVESAVGVPSVIYDSFTNLDKYMSGTLMGRPWKHLRAYPRGSRSGDPEKYEWRYHR